MISDLQEIPIEFISPLLLLPSYLHASGVELSEGLADLNSSGALNVDFLLDQEVSLLLGL